MTMASDNSAIRAKELQQLFDYWQRKRRDRMAPARADIVPTEIRLLLPRVFIVEIVGSPPRFRFRLAGTLVVDRFGEEITGRFLDELDLDERDREIVADYLKTAETRAPVCSRWSYVKHDGTPLRYERLLLPLSSDGRTVDMILGGAAEEPPSGREPDVTVTPP
jgi:hypothetical protein